MERKEHSTSATVVNPADRLRGYARRAAALIEESDAAHRTTKYGQRLNRLFKCQTKRQELIADLARELEGGAA